MAGTLFRSMFNSLSLYRSSNTNLRTIHTSSAYYAARKGTRAKARAKKVKVEVTKVGFIPHNQRKQKDKALAVHVNKHLDDSFKMAATDDVYPLRYYRWVVYTAEDAVRAHQETHHPTMYNVPDAYVFAQVHLNMEAVKKTRTIDNFNKLVLLPHSFPRDEERSILAFVKGQDLIKQTLEAGATLAGSTELVRKIQDGEIVLADYDHVVAHPNILTDLVPIRGLMKRRFPNVRSGTLDPNIADMVKKFAGGIQVKAVKDEQQPNFASINVAVGRLNMDAKQVAENIDSLLKDIQVSRPKRPGLFVTKCFLTSPPSHETLKIDPFAHVEKELSKEVQDDSDDEEDAVATTA